MSNQLTLANIQERFRKCLNDESNCVVGALAKLEAKTKVKREYLAYGEFNFYLNFSSLSYRHQPFSFKTIFSCFYLKLTYSSLFIVVVALVVFIIIKTTIIYLQHFADMYIIHKT
jgi:hypothetical protein